MLPFLCTVYADGIAQRIVTQLIVYVALFTQRRHYIIRELRHGEHAMVGGRVRGWVSSCCRSPILCSLLNTFL